MSSVVLMSQLHSVQQLPAQPITPEAFQPYGQLIQASPDGKSFDATDAQLVLDQGRPRFYIMRLHQRGRQFSKITRHRRCTQCLGSLNGASWLIAVAPPNCDLPGLDSIVAFQIPGDCFINLAVGTWHAGPYFDQEIVDFYNLELSDTNITDHDTYDLKTGIGTIYEIT
jgi:ureidoglycolate hydrolase